VYYPALSIDAGRSENYRSASADDGDRGGFVTSCAHVLATAILRIWPEAQFAAGPPVENGF